MPVSYISRGFAGVERVLQQSHELPGGRRLIERYSGAKVLSAQTIWQLVQQSALGE